MLSPAKINLFLHVTGKRPDGYHLLESLIVFANKGDNLTVSASDARDFTLCTIDGPFARHVPKDGTNLILQTANILAQHYAISTKASFALTKLLPVGAGIGGGSMNAASAAKLLCSLWDIPYNIEELSRLLLPLGADIPVCLHGQSSFIQHIGETITPAPLGFELYAVLVNPRIHVSTADIFKAGFPSFSPKLDTLDSPKDRGDFMQWLQTLNNDLLFTASEQVPEIEMILDVLHQDTSCQFATMSGSGATCIGLYNSADEAHKAAKRIENVYSNWWVIDAILR